MRLADHIALRKKPGFWLSLICFMLASLGNMRNPIPIVMTALFSKT
jgi:hypothetical protein